jgi:1-acyl-sn-glycerol-3-phosphate acyltransferase
LSAWPVLGDQIPLRGSALARGFGHAVLRVLGWRVEGEVPNLPKLVIAVAPHTSNWDFVVGIAVMFALDLRIGFLGKHTLFRWPFGRLMRWMGGIPVDRASPHGVVGDSIAAFSQVERRILAIAPEGTRRPVAHFKSGFLQIARGAGVPVVLATLDYAAKCVRFGPWFTPGEDVEGDRRRTEAFFAPVRGKRPRQSA